MLENVLMEVFNVPNHRPTNTFRSKAKDLVIGINAVQLSLSILAFHIAKATGAFSLSMWQCLNFGFFSFYHCFFAPNCTLFILFVRLPPSKNNNPTG